MQFLKHSVVSLVSGLKSTKDVLIPIYQSAGKERARITGDTILNE